MSWLRDFLGARSAPRLSEGAQRKSEPAKWRSADDPGNPFGVELLDLTQLLHIISTSESQQEAKCSVSWRPGEHHRIHSLENVSVQRCELRYPAADELPDGIVYAPPSMDFKWVVAWVGGELRIARSWTGTTCAIARGKLYGQELVLSEVAFAENSGFGMFSRDPVRDLDWLIRTHVFDQRIPMVVDEDGAALLEAVPMSGFGPWGRALFCAARAFKPQPPSGFLCSAGEVVAAAYAGDVHRVRSLLDAGHSATAPALNTYRPLQIAAQLGNRELVELFIEHGASIDQVDRTSAFPACKPLAAGPSLIVRHKDHNMVTGRGAARIKCAVAPLVRSPPVELERVEHGNATAIEQRHDEPDRVRQSEVVLSPGPAPKVGGGSGGPAARDGANLRERPGVGSSGCPLERRHGRPSRPQGSGARPSDPRPPSVEGLWNRSSEATPRAAPPWR